MGVEIAALDWMHSDWYGSFYPDDLPSEWRLEFYANEFDAVVVPDYRWLEAQGSDIDEWYEETGDTLSFYWHVPPDVADARQLQPLLQKLAHHSVAGFVITETPSGAERIARLASELERVAPVAITAPWPYSEAMTLRLSAEEGAVPILVVHGQPALTELRHNIEQLAKKVGVDGHGLIICAGRPPSVELLRNCYTLVHLLGV